MERQVLCEDDMELIVSMEKQEVYLKPMFLQQTAQVLGTNDS